MLTKFKYYLKEWDWKDEHFATNLMQIDGEVSESVSVSYIL